MEEITRLGHIYKQVLGKDFNGRSFDDRLKLQKIVYLLENMGVSIGDYNYRWYKHGPYSQTLQDEILDNKTIINPSDLYLSDYAKEKIKDLNKTLSSLNDPAYDLEQWLECLASLLFIKRNEKVSNENELINILIDRKPHLDKRAANYRANDTIDLLFC